VRLKQSESERERERYDENVFQWSTEYAYRLGAARRRLRHWPHIQQHSGSAAARAIKICLAAPQVSDHVRRIKKMLLDLQMLSAVVF
jgi:hypothetical protein